LTGSPGRPGQFFFFLNQNNVILVKKKTKINRLQPGFLPNQPGHTGFFLPLFFLQPGPVLVPGRPAGLGWVLKLWW
jgi:hypothetical protein